MIVICVLQHSSPAGPSPDIIHESRHETAQGSTCEHPHCDNHHCPSHAMLPEDNQDANDDHRQDSDQLDIAEEDSHQQTTHLVYGKKSHYRGLAVTGGEMGPRGGYLASSPDRSQGCGYNQNLHFIKHRTHQSCQTDNMVLWALPMPSFQHPHAGAILVNPEVNNFLT